MWTGDWLTGGGNACARRTTGIPGTAHPAAGARGENGMSLAARPSRRRDNTGGASRYGRGGLLLDAPVEHAGSGRIAVIGANSAVGTALLAQVAGRDALDAVAVVRRPEVVGALPQSPRILPRVVDYRRSDSLADAFASAGAVVHLAGILFESRTSDYRSGNVDVTRAVVEAARSAAVGHIVFVSSLGADPRSRNGYFQSKGEAERVVAGSGLDATIIRTPLLLGPGTAGGRALLAAASGPSARVLGGGAHRLRPLDVDDLCRAIQGCCEQPAAGVRTCDLVGPTTLTHRELLERTASCLGRELPVRSTPVWLARLGAGLVGLVRTGGLTPAVIDVITSDEAVDGNADGELGVSLTPLSDTLAKLCQTPPR